MPSRVFIATLRSNVTAYGSAARAKPMIRLATTRNSSENPIRCIFASLPEVANFGYSATRLESERADFRAAGVDRNLAWREWRAVYVAAAFGTREWAPFYRLHGYEELGRADHTLGARDGLYKNAEGA